MSHTALTHRLSGACRLVLLLTCCCRAAVAEESEQGPSPLPGHSRHGEVFNEGPRQAAYLMDGTGEVDFPVTTNQQQAQQFINQGMGQLHGFWYFEAERSFRQAAALDPDCAMAYWGAAMANLGTEKRAAGFIAKAVKLKDKVSPRELMYIEGLDAYLRAGKRKQQERQQRLARTWESILYKYPEDGEAKALLVLQLWKNDTTESHLAIDALLSDLFEQQPLHPAHHYRIHLWDRERPEAALSSAALCGPAAPAIAHMWHMPGHIYSRLKRYRDAAWQQEASARVDHAQMMRDRLLPDQIHNFAHNNEWLIRNLNHLGRVHDAIDLATNMIELPRHPQYNTLSKRGSTHYGRLRLAETLRRYEMWSELIAMYHSPYLEATADPAERTQRLQHLGEAYFRAQQREAGERQLAELQQLREEQQIARQQAEQLAEEQARGAGKEEKAIAAARSDAGKTHQRRVQAIDRAIAELEVHRAVSQHDYEMAAKRLQDLRGIDTMYKAQVLLLAGRAEEALKLARKHVAAHESEVQPLALLVDLLWQNGDRTAAAEELEKLRMTAAAADLDVPVLARLEPLAQQLGLPADWRHAAPEATDIGERPPLDSLGPFRWQPVPAIEWTLPDAQGRSVARKQFEGQPIVVIFYLGYGCLHCAEQLQSFAPLADKFAAAGIELVAISSDDQQGLAQSLRNYDGQALPIPLLSDPSLEVFRAYRCYDDFEQQPLHGTFLIDGQGRQRWQSIGHEPFMDARFLLQEAQRLLSHEPSTAATSLSRR